MAWSTRLVLRPRSSRGLNKAVYLLWPTFAAANMASQGASNDGLLVDAVVNQQPDLIAAALAQFGVMDMLCFDKFTGGELWVDEYGDPAKEEDFRNLLRDSPYHNIQPGKSYWVGAVALVDRVQGTMGCARCLLLRCPVGCPEIDLAKAAGAIRNFPAVCTKKTFRLLARPWYQFNLVGGGGFEPPTPAV